MKRVVEVYTIEAGSCAIGEFRRGIRCLAPVGFYIRTHRRPFSSKRRVHSCVAHLGPLAISLMTKLGKPEVVVVQLPEPPVCG